MNTTQTPHPRTCPGCPRCRRRGHRPVLVVLDVATMEITFADLTAQERAELHAITWDYNEPEESGVSCLDSAGL